jgi:hypothetical protein
MANVSSPTSYLRLGKQSYIIRMSKLVPNAPEYSGARKFRMHKVIITVGVQHHQSYFYRIPTRLSIFVLSSSLLITIEAGNFTAG